MKNLVVLFKTKPNTMRSILLVIFLLGILPLIKVVPFSSGLINPFSNLPAYLCLIASLILGTICWVRMQVNPSFWPAILTIVSLTAVILTPSLLVHNLFVTLACFFVFGLLGIWSLFVLIELKLVDCQVA